MKSIGLVMGTLALVSTCFFSTGVAMASTGPDVPQFQGKQLVALGDSISYGYNLGPNNQQPSQYAFPYLIGQMQGATVRDLAVPGATSSDLLNLLQTSQQVKLDVQKANIVTIDIGSNDLLSIAYKDGLLTNSSTSLTTTEEMQFAAAIQQFSKNLPAILEDVHALAPTANIVLYNLYDPIPAQDAGLHTLAEQMIGKENQIISSVAAEAHLPVADAYDLFNNRQQLLILPNDVHPNKLGQDVLAFAGESVLMKEETMDMLAQVETVNMWVRH